jgi:hypothetical protein
MCVVCSVHIKCVTNIVKEAPLCLLSKAAKIAAKRGDGLGHIALCSLKKIEAKKAAIDDDSSSDGTASS